LGAAIQLLVFFLGCGASSPNPLAATATLLRLGLDPEREADALEESLVAAGLRRRLRIDGRTHSSLWMVRPGTSEAVVRVVTRAGIALGVDAPEQTGGRAVGLLDLHGDVDGDGHEEIGVFADDPARDRRCIAVLRVDAQGRVHEVRLDTRSLQGDACIEAFEDIDGDGRVEALVVARYPELSVGTPPRVAVPFRTRGWRPLRDGPARAFARAQRLRREVGLRAAREQADAHAAYRLGVELAGLARLAGEGSEAQVAALRSAVAGLELTAGLAAAVEEAAAFIRRGWRAADDPALPP